MGPISYLANLPRPASETMVGVVSTVVLLHVALLRQEVPSQLADARWYSGSLVLAYLVAAGFLVYSDDAWLTVPAQFSVAATIAGLDWVAFYQSPYRFSDADLCLGGTNCRLFSMAAGFAAHTADTLGMATVLYFASPTYWPQITAGAATYWYAGMDLVYNMTRDGSVSDCRKLDDDATCARATLMPNAWRGTINDTVLALDMILAWQAIRSTCPTANCGVASTTKDFLTPSSYALAGFRLALILGPMYFDFVGSHVQHGFRAADVGLPACFDDAPAAQAE